MILPNSPRGTKKRLLRYLTESTLYETGQKVKTQPKKRSGGYPDRFSINTGLLQHGEEAYPCTSYSFPSTSFTNSCKVSRNFSASIDQNTGKPGLTTTTAIRLLLDKAANVEEALGSGDVTVTFSLNEYVAGSENSG